MYVCVCCFFFSFLVGHLYMCCVFSFCLILLFIPWQLAHTLLPDTNDNIIVIDIVVSVHVLHMAHAYLRYVGAVHLDWKLQNNREKRSIFPNGRVLSKSISWKPRKLAKNK